ncbi:MAG: hypothetical protein RDV48_07410 [Candidatus Eremiobacteraeota bacterium]|nr:hypothetical protein [Candidatus Eremiobacteraeota bacterium]
MEGISDAQKYRQLNLPGDSVRKEERDRDKKVTDIEERQPRQDNQEGQSRKEDNRQEGGMGQQSQGDQVHDGPQASQQQAAAAGKDEGIDPGGQETYISKGGSKITDADEVVAIAKICAEHNQMDIKAGDLCKDLKEQGFDCYETTIDGKPAIRFANGDVFIDSSGNNALGLEDGDFTKALDKIEQKFGLNLDTLQAKVQELTIKRYAHEGEDGGLECDTDLLAGGFQGIQEADGAGEAGGASQGGDLSSQFEQIDRQLGERGYKGPKAQELYERELLDDTLKQYGVNAPMRQDLAQKIQYAGAFAGQLFNAALVVSRLKERSAPPA